MIQSNAIITRSNITWYYLQHCSNWDRNKSEVELTNDTPYLALKGELCGIFFEGLGENGPGYNATALYIGLLYNGPQLYMLIQWHLRNHMTAPVPVTQPWRTHVNYSTTMLIRLTQINRYNQITPKACGNLPHASGSIFMDLNNEL